MANNFGVFGDTACIASTVDAGSTASRRYYIARRTLFEMLRDRGYVVANMESELCRSLADFRSTFGDNPEPERLRVVACRASDPSRKVYIPLCL